MEIALLATITAALIAFSVQNEATIPISFLFWQFETPLAVVIFFSVLSGVLVLQLLKHRTGKRSRSKGKPV